MKRSGWTPERGRAGFSRKKGTAKAVNEILKASYRLHARDRATLRAVKHCLG